MKAALKRGRNKHKGTGLNYLAPQLGMGREWCRIKRKMYFKRFTPIWKPILTAENMAKRLRRRDL